MDRLTKYLDGGDVRYNHGTDLVYDTDILNRLAAYEDTGLMPEEIQSLQAELERVKAEREKAISEIHSMDSLSGKCTRCKSWNGVRCKKGYTVNASFCNDWQWRGLTTNTETEGR